MTATILRPATRAWRHAPTAERSVATHMLNLSPATIETPRRFWRLVAVAFIPAFGAALVTIEYLRWFLQ